VTQCRTTYAKGCFDGYILATKEFTVNGKQFFDASDLATRFGELISADVKGYQVALVSELDNQSFLQGFEYVLTGNSMLPGKARSNGGFSLNELAEGSYDLRVFRSVKFTASYPKAAAPAKPAEPAPAKPAEADGSVSTPLASESAPATTDPGVQDAPEMVTKTYCATLYADTTVDVRRAKRSTETFSDFRLHVTEDECTAAGTSATISLDD
jgi:hypothetical protein